MKQLDTIIIGGGAAGMMAACRAAFYGKQVAILERNSRMGRKLLITGKGRCNVTNNCDIKELVANVPGNGNFLYSAFSHFSPQDTIDFFESLGVPLKTERGRRVFPVSDKAADIVNALTNAVKRAGVQTNIGTATALKVDDGHVCGIDYTDQNGDACHLGCNSIIVATGGMSYPRTGSTGEGYKLAKSVGHTIIEPSPSLVPVETTENWCKEAQGLSLKNATLRIMDNHDKVVFEELGEMLFTHFGVSGPLVLSASAHMRNIVLQNYRMCIDLKPGLRYEQLDARLLRDFEGAINKDIINALGALLPRKLIPIVLQLSRIPFDTKVNQLTRQQRAALCDTIKGLALTPKRFRPIDEAIITRGGVHVKEINPKTMESKLVEGLFFAGEVIDVDAYTGGYNLQIAFSTGVLAGEHC